MHTSHKIIKNNSFNPLLLRPTLLLDSQFNITLTSGNVSTWGDLSPSKSNFTATTVQKPGWTAPAGPVQFNSGTQAHFMSNTTYSVMSGPFSIIWVSNNVDTTNGAVFSEDCLVNCISVGYNGSKNVHLQIDSGGNAGLLVHPGTPISITGFVGTGIQTTTCTATPWLNGVKGLPLTRTDYTAIITPLGCRIGKNMNAQNAFEGSIYWITVIPRMISDYEMITLTKYLVKRYSTQFW